MDQASLQACLADLRLPLIRFFPSIDSTNDEAWRCVETGTPHSTLVIADEQTAGRGRFQRHWVTTHAAGLAFSLVLYAPPLNSRQVHLLTGLGAVAVCQALQATLSLPAEVKWPNDVLLGEGKVAGILVEARWDGDQLKSAVVGIGINIAPHSISPDHLTPSSLDFPAASIEGTLGRPVDRLGLLHAILEQFFSWLPRLATSAFISLWEANLAYRGQAVELTQPFPIDSPRLSAGSPPVYSGTLVGLTMDGAIKLLTGTGDLVTAQVGELHLRLAGQPG